MSNRSRPNSEKLESSIPNWVGYVLLSFISLLIANFLHGSVVAVTATGILMLFILSYLSKPVADIQPIKEENIFDRNKINKNTWKNPSEPNPQRRRYLRSINEKPRKAA